MSYGADAQRDPVGRGLRWPPDVDSTGRVRWSVPIFEPSDTDRRDAMASKLRQLLLTIAGQRCLRRGWGTDIAGLLFLPALLPLVSSILREAVEAVRRELPGVAITSAQASTDQDAGLVTFVFGWRMVSSGFSGEATIPIGLESREPNLG